MAPQQGKWAENPVRFWIESRMRIIDQEKRGAIDYHQCASCKSENTFAPKDLFHKDNYDFLPIFGPEDGVIFRRKAWLNAGYRQIRKARCTSWCGERAMRLLRRQDASASVNSNGLTRDRAASGRWVCGRR